MRGFDPVPSWEAAIAEDWLGKRTSPQRGEVPSECERVRGPWPQQVLWCDAFDDEVVKLSIFLANGECCL